MRGNFNWEWGSGNWPLILSKVIPELRINPIWSEMSKDQNK